MKSNENTDDIYETYFDQSGRQALGEELGFWGTVGDIAMGVPRGVAGAVEGVLELPTIFGLDYDIPDNFGLGESKTMAGGVVDGIVNFGAGFMMGGAGVGAKAAGALKATKAGKGLMGGTPRAFLKGGTIRNELVTAGLQGAATDLMFFKGNEGRLSDLIQSSPSLANPISEFLASDEEDSELTGRLKNAIEGLGIGLAVDSLLIPLRALKAGRKKFEETGDVNKANEEAAKVYTEEEIRPWMESFDVDRPTASALAAHAAHFGLGPEHMIVGQAAGGARLFQVDTTKFFHTTYDGLLKFNDNDSLANVKKSIGGKNAEWDFTGLNELLESNPNATVGDAKANFKPVEVEEEIFPTGPESDPSMRDAKVEEYRNELHTATDGELVAMYEDLWPGRGPDIEEILRDDSIRTEIIDEFVSEYDPGNTKYDAWVPEGVGNYRELAVRWKDDAPADVGRINARYPKPKMPSEAVHNFGDNTMFHVRFGDKIEGDKKILYVFEMQSDWTRQGQEGRWEGEPRVSVEEAREVTGNLKRAKKDVARLQDEAANLRKKKYASRDSRAKQQSNLEEINKELRAAAAERDKLLTIQKKITAEPTPDHPFVKTWLNSGVERMFKLAAEEGYDGIRFADVESAREVTGLGRRKIDAFPSLRGTDKDPAHVIYGRQIPKLAKKFAKKNGVGEAAPPSTDRFDISEGMQGWVLSDLYQGRTEDKFVRAFDSKAEAEAWAVKLLDIPVEDTFMFDTKSPHMGSRAATLRPTSLFQDTSVQQGRSAALQDAAATIGEKGGVTASEYQTLVNELKPVAPYKFIPPAATAPQMKSALKKGQVDKVNAPIKDGQQVGLRLDIPAYSNHGTWVPTIHGADGKPISHRAVAVITDATFGAKETQSLRVAKGGAKSPFATIDGAFENGTKKATMAEAKAALNDPEYVQVGFDPERHSYFYDRTTQEPVIGAERVIQVGPLVLAKKPKYGKKSDFLFQDEGKAVDPYDTAKGVTEFGEDGKAYIRGLNNPDASTAVHEMGHVVRRRYYSMPEADGGFTAAERTILDEWVGATDGRWDVNGEEKFARGFELYVREGALPEGAPQGLRGVFQTLATAMLDIYRRVAGSAVDVKIDPKVKEVFDALFERGGKGAEPMSMAETVAWKPDRLDWLIKRSTAGHHSDDGSTSAVAWIAPLDFIRATTPSEEGVQSIIATAKRKYRKPKPGEKLGTDKMDGPDAVYGEFDYDKMSDPESSTPFGDPTATPRLYIRGDGSGSTIKGADSHEGRHRMAAMHERGVKEVPVLLTFSGADYDTFHPRRASANVSGQSGWPFPDGVSGKDVKVKDVIGLSRNNREAILERMGKADKLFQEPDNTGAARKAKAEKAAQRAPEYDGNVVNEDGSVVYLDSTASDIGEVYSIPSDLEGRPDLVSSDDTARDLFIKARDLRRNDERFKAMSYEEKLIAAEQRAHTIYETSNVEGTEALAEIATSGQRVFEDSLTHIYAMQDVEAALLRQHKQNIITIRDLKKEGKEPPPQMIAQAMVVEKQLGAASDSVITNMESLARAFASRRRKGKGSAITTTELEGKYVDGVETEEFTKLVGAIENGKVDGEKWYEQTVLAIEKGDVNAMRVSNSRYKMGWGHVLMEAYYSSLLSGVKTQTVNAMGSWMNTIIMPIEKMIGRALVTDANAKQQLAMLANLPRQAMESLGMIPVVLREGSSQLDPGGRSSLTDATGMHRGRTNVAEVAGLDNTAAGTVMNWLHGVGTFPLRALGAVDEFAKQTNYRAHVLADLTQKAKDVHPSDGVAQQKWVQKKFDLMTEDGKMYSARTMWNKAERMAREQVGEAGDDAKYLIREKATELFNDMWDNDLGNVAKEGLRLAREATFTSANNPNLGANPASRAIQGAGAALQRGLAKHPVGRLIVPFVNTPTNLATWFVDRQFSPMFDGWKLVKSKLKPEYDQAIYGGDPNLKADAVGRLVTGSMMTVTALGAITAGKLTGGGPRDSQQRQIWLSAGNQPYSIKTDDGWISYKRLDPWASFLGVTADLVEGMAHQAENEDDSLPLDIFMATTMAFSRNLREKTYLQGITQAVQALTNPEVHGARWIRGFASAGMPTLIKDMNSDPYYREIRSATDQWLSRTPGMSDELMPRRDLLGEPIEKPGYWAPGGLEFMSPFAYSQVSSDVVKKELASREHGFSPPQANKNGVDLREVVSKSGQTSYDRWQELHSTVKLNGRTLREALEHLIESPRYQRMVETPDYDPKVGELRKVLSRYRSRAYREVEKEFPQLLESRIQTKRRQAAARYGRNIQDILNY